MRKAIVVLLLMLSAVAAFGQGQANIAGLLLASNFTGWSVAQGNNGNYNWTSNTFCIVSAGGLTFNAFTVGVPVYLADTANPSSSEVVTPTAVVINNSGCSIRINPANQHQSFYFRTATAGLGEAIGFANKQAFEVVLTPQWQQLGGETSMITSSIGNAAVSILDQRTSIAQPYTWNGTMYVPAGSAACSGGCVTSINAFGFAPITNAVTFQGSGTTTINQVGQVITISSTGGGGGGSPTTAPFDLLAANTGQTAFVDLQNYYATSGNTAQQAYTAAAANNGSFTIQPSAGRVPFVATGNTRANDERGDVPATAIGVTEKGAVCDLRSIYGTFTSASKAFTVTNGTLTAADVGKTIVAVGSVSGTPTAFESVMQTFTDSAHGSVTTNFPFTQSSPRQMDLGHDDTTAISNTMTAVGAGGTLIFPEGNCLTHAQLLEGQSPVGLGVNSRVTTFPGENGFAAPDPAVAIFNGQGASHIHDLTGNVDGRIDATQAWQIINDSGTFAKPAMYNPIDQRSAIANDPLAPGWFQGSGPNLSGAFNGVASIQAASAVMCVPSSQLAPSAGTAVVFPYLPTVFTATVSSSAGSCSGGASPRTLSAPLPTGSTNAQAEWMAGSSPQHLQTSIGSGSCPTTITLANSINPVAGYESNVAPFGLIQIDAEQFTYTSKSVAANPSPANTFYGISCAQNSTTRAAHSTGATVVPLNPFQPTYPWPVTPTLNANDTTPAGTAGYYPGWNVGNAFFAFPVASGISQSYAVGGWSSNAHIENLSFSAWPSDNALNSFEINHTAAYYYAQPSYATTFSNWLVFGLFYGIAGGPPSIENGNWARQQPTQDGTHYDGITIFAANPVNIPYGNENTYSNFNVYSEEQNSSGAALGADTCYYFTSLWNDQTGGITQANTLDHFKNLYCEPEAGAHAGTMVNWEFDTINSEIEDQHMGGQGEFYMGLGPQHWVGGNFNQSPGAPAINFGVGNTSDYSTLLGQEPKSNVYGQTSLVNLGEFGNFTGTTANSNATAGGPYGPVQSGNSRAPIPSQTMETFNTGNLTAPYVSSAGGLITPEEFNTSSAIESQPMSIGWTFDDTSPITHSYAACNVGNSGSTVYCNPFKFNGNGIGIGPDQRVTSGKYNVFISAKDVTAATNSFNMVIGVASGCSTTAGPQTVSIPIKNTWPVGLGNYFNAIVDFSGATPTPGCQLAFAIEGATTADQIQIGFVAMAPVAENLLAGKMEALNGLFDLSNQSNSGKCVQWGSLGQLTAASSACSSASLTNPMTAVGDMIYGGTSGVPTRLAGNTSTTPAMIVGTGSGSAATAPAWTPATGTGAPVLATSPALITPNIGSATGTSLALSGPATGISGLGTASYTLGATGQVGTGATSPACVTNVVCDSLSGTFSFTTGTGSLTAGTVATVTLPGTRTNVPTCPVTVKGGTTFLGPFSSAANTSGTVTLPITTEVALAASTAYSFTYGLCGGI
jgi:hypothetical protein